MKPFKREGVMLWFILGAVVGNLFGMLLMAIFTAGKGSERTRDAALYENNEDAYGKHIAEGLKTAD
ncbi:MAG: hypothetical protein C4526_01195 [Nitrospiraceae bacterium]|nr:MAG: hypothetical protein C4526_01195 [Nitrospiraceae bacterium]